MRRALLAKRMGKTRLIAETGAGQHGMATAMVAALMGMECTIYMGARDVARQQPNVYRMRLMGAKVVPVSNEHGEALSDAIDVALADWVESLGTTTICWGRPPAAPVPEAGEAVPKGYFGGVSAANAGAHRPAAGCGGGVCWWGFERHWVVCRIFAG